MKQTYYRRERPGKAEEDSSEALSDGWFAHDGEVHFALSCLDRPGRWSLYLDVTK